MGLCFARTALALVTTVVSLRYHLPEPAGVLLVTVNGHTFFGNPPALTLYQRDPLSFLFIVVSLGVSLFAATAELVVRTVLRRNRAGVIAITIGVVVVLFSFFGLLLVGRFHRRGWILLIVSGQPSRPRKKRSLVPITSNTPNQSH